MAPAHSWLSGEQAARCSSARPRRHANQFTYAPIIEVAVLFLGIFLTMAPALEFLEQHGTSLGVNTPARFFWVTGAFSSFIDNAPTYVTFFEAARAQAHLTLDGTTVAGVPDAWLKAISLGAVFLWVPNSYIGNGPNFMVKAVAEEAGSPDAVVLRVHGLTVASFCAPLCGITLWCFRLQVSRPVQTPDVGYPYG